MYNKYIKLKKKKKLKELKIVMHIEDIHEYSAPF